MNRQDERTELDLKEIVDGQFQAGRGTLLLNATMSDALIVAMIRQALAHATSFTIIPGEPYAVPSKTPPPPTRSTGEDDPWPRALFVGFGDAIAADFRAGRGVLGLSTAMPDGAIAAGVRAAMAYGQPFQVAPRAETIFWDEGDTLRPGSPSGT